MNPIGSQRRLWLFAGLATLMALTIVLVPIPALAWILDLLTAVVAGAASLAVCVRLSFAPNQVARIQWLAALCALGLVCIGQLVELFGAPDTAATWMAYYLSLGTVPVLTWLLTGRDPMPHGAAMLLGAGVAVQLAGAVAARRLESPNVADLLKLIAVETYFLGIAWFVGHLRWRSMTVDRRATDVGDLARYLFATSLPFKKVRHPRIGSYTLPGHKSVLVIGRFLTWFPLIAPRVRARFGIGLWRQFRDLWTAVFRHGLDAQVYYMFELYRRDHRARASGYLTRYELKNGLYKALTLQVPKGRHRIMLGDKLGTYRICEEHGIATVPIIIYAEDGNLQYLSEHPTRLNQDLFIKPRQSKGSRGAEFIRYVDGQYVRETGETLDQAGLIAFIAQRSKETPFLVQPRIGNHPDLADLADTALMRIRVITCLDDGGQPVITHAVLSNLCKLELNWPTDIEFGAAIDLETGTLGLMTGDKAEAWLNWSEDHPITGARVFGRIVPCWNEVRSISLAAHYACKDRLLIGWDLVVGPDGALLLEGNSYPDVDFLQRSHQCAIGDSPLGPLLYARLVDLERRTATGTLRGPLDYG